MTAGDRAEALTCEHEAICAPVRNSLPATMSPAAPLPFFMGSYFLANSFPVHSKPNFLFHKCGPGKPSPLQLAIGFPPITLWTPGVPSLPPGGTHGCHRSLHLLPTINKFLQQQTLYYKSAGNSTWPHRHCTGGYLIIIKELNP